MYNINKQYLLPIKTRLIPHIISPSPLSLPLSLSLLYTVPTEYVLMEQAAIPLSSAMSHASLSCIHVGIAMAKESATHCAPLFHIAPPKGETTLWYVRTFILFFFFFFFLVMTERFLMVGSFYSASNGE